MPEYLSNISGVVIKSACLSYLLTFSSQSDNSFEAQMIPSKDIKCENMKSSFLYKALTCKKYECQFMTST